MSHAFEIYKDRSSQYHLRFKYNSEILWSSKGYPSKIEAQNSIKSVNNAIADMHRDTPLEMARDLKRRLENAVIPEPDRIVSVDHNSEASKEFRNAIQKLEESIREANNVGHFSEEELEVAKYEILQLHTDRNKKNVRPNHIWQNAKNTLLWIFNHAAGALIGAIALSALAALANLLNINF